MSQTDNTLPQIETKVSSNANFSFSKDDILLIATEAREAELIPKIESLTEAIQECTEQEKELIKAFQIDILEILAQNIDTKIFRLPDSITVNNHYYSNSSKILHTYTHYNIEKASEVKNVKVSLLRNKVNRSLTALDYRSANFDFYIFYEVDVLGKKEEVSLNITFNPEKETNRLSSKDSKKVVKLIKDMITTLNEVRLKGFKLKEELNLAEKDLILLDSDKTIKANLYKKILSQNPELQKLIS